MQSSSAEIKRAREAKKEFELKGTGRKEQSITRQKKFDGAGKTQTRKLLKHFVVAAKNGL